MAKKKAVQKNTVQSGKADNSKIVAVLAYLLVGIIWYFVDEKVKGDDFAKFHVKQALVLLILSIAVSIVGSFLIIISLGLLTPLYGLLQLCVFVLWLFGIIYAATDKKKELPIIGKFAEKFTF